MSASRKMMTTSTFINSRYAPLAQAPFTRRLARRYENETRGLATR
ncbi:hypothetical protein SARI_03177 [Salmonella enterica subsp. arizonae serovar 62:z4,z23:-]|uniref:Uncharacterized protein n=1 Tax=Salmonella arizonae (strain ATCC BAA-731 / CDC346-86 / RSK2980) TaxID=41514 RepID=A9MEU8_SALAR|nr:hypothetical protein SARI_03177 [Salmonella enterica subsp. arizonae serovar 62:z4,z23:-]